MKGIFRCWQLVVFRTPTSSFQTAINAKLPSPWQMANRYRRPPGRHSAAPLGWAPRLLAIRAVFPQGWRGVCQVARGWLDTTLLGSKGTKAHHFCFHVKWRRWTSEVTLNVLVVFNTWQKCWSRKLCYDSWQILIFFFCAGTSLIILYNRSSLCPIVLCHWLCKRLVTLVNFKQSIAI